MSPRARARFRAALCAFVIALAFGGGARPALAWVDVNVEADDVRISLDKSGDARVEHKITLKIAGGPLRSLDVRGVDADATPELDAYVVPQKEAAKSSLASAQSIVAERMPPDTKPRADGSPAPIVLRLRFDQGLGRGVYVILVRYTTRLLGRGAPDGALTRIAWRGPIWDDGFDSARVTFDLPAAPTPPRADSAEPTDGLGGGKSPLVISNLRRGTSRDQLELLRPYAPKGESITWAVRVDARALAPVAAAPPPKGVRETIDGALGEPAQRALLALAALSLFLFYSSLVALKSVETARFARAAGARPRPFLALPTAIRAVLAGAALVVGVFVQMRLLRATVGALFVLAAVLLAAHRTPRWPRAALRGPGRWLPIAEALAFRPAPRPRGAFLDVSTRAGKAFLLVALAAVFAAVWILADTSPFRAELVAFDAVALLAVFCTGRIAELPPDPATAPSRLLGDVARRVRKVWPVDAVRLVGRIRVPDGSAEADELRLVVAPRTAPTGFGALEIGVVFAPGAGGPLALPEVILRVTSGSPCEQLLARQIRHGRAVRGRKKGEQAVVFTPRLPTARMTAQLVIALLRALMAPRAARPSKADRPRVRRAA
jgi:membrane protein implicated in regulation of membrane protease activity